MKKQTLRTLLVALVAMVWVGAAQAQSKYDLWIAGVQVTSANCGDLASAIPGVEGTVKYDPTTNALTLQDATIHSTEEGAHGIWTWIEGLNIQLLGKNSIIAENGCGIFNDNYSDLTIKGEGSLVVKGATTGDKESQVAIKNRGRITVSGCTIEASAGVSGLAGGGWRFDHCTLRAKGGGSEVDKYAGSISYVSMEPSLWGCAITAPEGVYWKEFSNEGSIYCALYCSVGEKEKPVTDWVTIAPAYDLEVAGVRVIPSTTNCDDLASAIPGVEGTVKYDPTTKTLTLQDATIHTTGEGIPGIRTWMDGLNIQLMGKNSITAENSYGIFNACSSLTNDRSLTIKGEGSLVVKGATTGDKESQVAIRNQSSITVSGCTVEASAGVCGLAGGVWTFDHCTLRAKGNGSEADEYAGSISWIWAKKPKFIGCAITAPQGTSWKDFEKDDYGLYHYTLFCKEGDEEKPVTDWVTIGPAYDLRIAGRPVTPANCGDLAAAIPGVEGTVKYDPTSKTLTLQDATIHTTEERAHGIWTWMDGLNIQLLGKNVITAENGYGIFNYSSRGLTIKGEGSLVVKGATTGDKESQYAITNLGSITVSGCTVEASAGVSGLAGGVWTFDHCTLRAKGGGSEADKYAGSIGYVSGKPGFFGCAITSPEGAYWKDFESRGWTCYTLFCRVGEEEKPLTDWVTIAPAYDLKVAGVQVNSANCEDLASANPNVTGIVKYDPTSKTLTLQDATIEAEGKFAIESGIEGLNVKVVGTSKLISKNYTTLSFAKPSTITGGGTLDVESTTDCAIYANKTSLTIENCTVDARAPLRGIGGFNGASGEILTIRNATVRAEGTGEGSIHGFVNVILEGCAIIEPEGAAFNESLHGVALDGRLVKSKVVITKGGTSIEGVMPNVPQKKRGIYNLEGIRLLGEWKDLPAGIYIVDGEKRIKE